MRDPMSAAEIEAVFTPLRTAVIGAGPSGFYAMGQLLAEGFEVDLFDVPRRRSGSCGRAWRRIIRRSRR